MPPIELCLSRPSGCFDWVGADFLWGWPSPGAEFHQRAMRRGKGLKTRCGRADTLTFVPSKSSSFYVFLPIWSRDTSV